MSIKLRRLMASETKRFYLKDFDLDGQISEPASLVNQPDNDGKQKKYGPPAEKQQSATIQFKSYFSQGRNQNLQRESQSAVSVLLFVLIYVGLDVWRQVSSYGMTYFNGGKYPMSHTWIVSVTESLKFFIFFAILTAQGNLRKIRPSLWFAVPAVIYCVNNNIYFIALYFTSPPIWNIFVQQRLILTALIYRLVFKRRMSRTQWTALAVLMVTIVMSQFSGGQRGGTIMDLTIAAMFAFIVSASSVVASFTMEYSFKNDNRNFSEMQVQLYFFSSVSSWTFFLLEKQPTLVLEGEKSLLLCLVVVNVLLSCCTGFTIAVMMKKLDSVVKLYTQALANMFTSLACATFYPRDFHLSLNFVVCLVAMVIAVISYERNIIPSVNVFNWLHSKFQGSRSSNIRKGP